MLTTERPYVQHKSAPEKAKAILRGEHPLITDAWLQSAESDPVRCQLLAAMRDCCHPDPLSRPSMHQVLSNFDQHLSDVFL